MGHGSNYTASPRGCLLDVRFFGTVKVLLPAVCRGCPTPFRRGVFALSAANPQLPTEEAPRPVPTPYSPARQADREPPFKTAMKGKARKASLTGCPTSSAPTGLVVGTNGVGATMSHEANYIIGPLAGGRNKAQPGRGTSSSTVTAIRMSEPTSI